MSNQFLRNKMIEFFYTFGMLIAIIGVVGVIMQVFYKMSNDSILDMWLRIFIIVVVTVGVIEVGVLILAYLNGDNLAYLNGDKVECNWLWCTFTDNRISGICLGWKENKSIIECREEVKGNSSQP